MDDRAHGLVRRLGIAMGNADGVILMQAEQHAGVAIAEMIDDGIMQPAIGGARIERHIFHAGQAQHLRGDV